VIQGNDVSSSVDSVPAGLARGPVFLRGDVGFTSDTSFLSMVVSPANDWRYDLYYRSGQENWKPLTSGTVEIPAQYKRMFGGS
jgi:hypothetical protein